MDPAVVWVGWLALFLIYEITAAVRERGTDQPLTLSRNVWRWFDRRGEKVALAVFMLTLTAHLVLGTPGALAVILTGAPVALVIALEVIRRQPPVRRPPTWGRIVVLLALPLLLGARGCSQDQQCAGLAAAVEAACASDRGGPEALPACQAAKAAWEAAGCAVVPVPTPTPAPPTTCVPPCLEGQRCVAEESLPVRYACVTAPPPPVNCLVTLCPAGQHCEQGIGCVADPLPPPEPAACPKSLAPGATVYLNDKRYGNGIDSTVRVKGDPEFCRLIHGVSANDCHLEGWPARSACEMELLGGCPIWEYSLNRIDSRGPCLMAPHPEASCDHHGDPVDRDDPMTPPFEGRPRACGLQRDHTGNPMGGFFVIGHGSAWFRSCKPDGQGCGPWVPGKDKR